MASIQGTESSSIRVHQNPFLLPGGRDSTAECTAMFVVPPNLILTAPEILSYKIAHNTFHTIVKTQFYDFDLNHMIALSFNGIFHMVMTFHTDNLITNDISR